ncbi:DUF2884 family protein [Grimontia sp. NTOU-MAR1]|uniref:DUF2884 family protein n=1 Tax=Grimontia sp. NTOU-MAR1 TaxID=3111011 RepID=UPI002DBA80EC|nr:DUF2884 family protein [Grimontia sp. NTOU-MAR1]WRV97125.1 DUF2884 family protein [Grimontia sp. NTOU-MAR1]
MGMVSLTNMMKVSCFLMATLPLFVTAESCRPELHGDIEIKSNSIFIEQNNNTFRIEPNGNLYVDVHRVSLSDAQKASLTAYSERVRADLPYFSKSLSDELKTSWRALDGVLAAELGEQSSLRGEFGQFHQYLQRSVSASFHAEDHSPQLNHKVLTNTVRELEASLPHLIATVSSRGLMDIAALSAGQNNRMEFISNKMARLQNKLADEVRVQRNRTVDVRQELCSRLGVWQEQESEISELIPALKGWKTVTVR